MKYEILQCMHLKRQSQGFHIKRPPYGCYIFVHFINPVDVTINGKTVRTAPNACIIYTPDAKQDYSAETIFMYHDYMHFNVDDDTAFLSKGLPMNTVFYTDMQESITRYVEYLEWARSSGQQRHIAKIQPTLDMMFNTLADEYRSNRVPFGQATKVTFDSLRSLVYQDPGRWNVPAMAEKAHLSRAHFSVRYREIFGVTPNEDIIRAALLRADKLLATTCMQIAEIAEECGFANPEYFIRLFKKRRGITPGQYRKSIAENGYNGGQPV